jgi:hypothetical protein
MQCSDVTKNEEESKRAGQQATWLSSYYESDYPYIFYAISIYSLTSAIYSFEPRIYFDIQLPMGNGEFSYL